MMLAHFGVDLRGDFFGVVAIFAEVAAEEHLMLAAAVLDRAERIAHAVLRHHAAREFGRFFEVVRRTGRDVAELDLFRDAAGEQLLDRSPASRFSFASDGLRRAATT